MIRVLNKETIDRISAGEVVERPVNACKELVENAIDSGAGSVTVEIKGGGIDMIRVTDNGCGISPDEIRTAFLRHSTSKIENADDLNAISTLGFRGEALASISSVSETEMVTALHDALTGVRILIKGGEEALFEEVGAPYGTTVIVRNLFFNTPARKKFLKTPSTEGSYILEMMEKIALSHPDISFQFISDGRSKFHTSGSGDLLEVIYRVFGKEISGSLVPIDDKNDEFSVKGYLGKPEIIRSNRNMEIYFMNGRYVRNNFISQAIEEGYREYLMLHKFPVVFLNFVTDPSCVDVNVHPAKLDIRISEPISFSSFVTSSVHDVMTKAEMIPENILTTSEDIKNARREDIQLIEGTKNPEPFERTRLDQKITGTVKAFSRFTGMDYDLSGLKESAVSEDEDNDFFTDSRKPLENINEVNSSNEDGYVSPEPLAFSNTGVTSDADYINKTVTKQMELFEDHLLEKEKRSSYRIIGQVFDTYWIVQYKDKMFIIDQHAAHEKVNYERMFKRINEGNHPSQLLMPPIIVSLTGVEEETLNSNIDAFRRLGFEIENFGGNEYALRGVPTDLFRHSEKELFLAVLDELSQNPGLGSFKTIDEKIASMACKASVKGGDRIGFEQAEKLIDELLTLDNPYNCPHGRPTIISISRVEMEKKFKRITD